jgi:hypothetical protein
MNSPTIAMQAQFIVKKRAELGGVYWSITELEETIHYLEQNQLQLLEPRCVADTLPGF